MSSAARQRAILSGTHKDRPDPPHIAHLGGWGGWDMNIKILNVVEDIDRHGNVRLYFRRRGHSEIRLRQPYGTASFWAEYKAAAENRHADLPLQNIPP